MLVANQLICRPTLWVRGLRCDPGRETGRACGFGTELSLDAQAGYWVIRVFDHNAPDQASIELTISPDGHIDIDRNRQHGELADFRSINF